MDGLKKYAVRERKGVKYVSGSNPQPINGAVIGYIVDNKYVPLLEETACSSLEELSYGSSILFRNLSADILEDLLRVFPVEDAYMIISAAAVRVIKPRASYSRVSQHHCRCFLSRFFPAQVGKNRISDLLERIGMDGAKRQMFFSLRVQRMKANHHLLIDEYLKTDGSKVNDLAHYSRKTVVRRRRDISLIYAYDLETREIVASQMFPGNSADLAGYRRFLDDNDIEHGVIITDKGFPSSKISAVLKDRPKPHHITPLTDNSEVIEKYNLLNFEGYLKGFDRKILYKKVAAEGRCLYVFKDLSLVSEQAEDIVVKTDCGKEFDLKSFGRKFAKAGVLTFESDLDLEPEAVYRAYEDRWEIEMVFDQFDNDLELDNTRVQENFSVIGNEFVNTIAAMVSRRIFNLFVDTRVLDSMTYGDAMEDLFEVWRKVDAPEEASTDDGYWTRGLKKDMELMKRLGLSKQKSEPLPKKRGKPKKVPEELEVKMSRGRPKKELQNEGLVS